MLYIIPHIIDYVFKKSYGKHHIQVNNVIKTLHDESSEKYTKFNHKNNPFDNNKLIWISKYICDENSHLCHHKYSLPYTKVLDVIACRVTSNIPGIGSIERSWVDVKTIKPGKNQTC